MQIKVGKRGPNAEFPPFFVFLFFASMCVCFEPGIFMGCEAGRRLTRIMAETLRFDLLASTRRGQGASECVPYIKN